MGRGVLGDGIFLGEIWDVANAPRNKRVHFHLTRFSFSAIMVMRHNLVCVFPHNERMLV